MLERVWRKGNPPTLSVGIEPDIATMENSMRVCVCVCVCEGVCVCTSVCVCACLCVLSYVRLSATPLDYSPPSSSVHRLFQVRILEWVAISFSRGSSLSRDQIRVSCVFCTVGQVLYYWATWEALREQYRGSLKN